MNECVIERMDICYQTVVKTLTESVIAYLKQNKAIYLL